MPPVPRAFVIGHPIGHSRSPLIHQHWLRELGIEGSYRRIDVAPAELPEFIRGLAEAGLAGGNVTVPHKTAILPLVEAVDAAGRAIGAVNTLWFDAGRLVAGNTDALGFLGSLDADAPDWDRVPGRALVVGAGGAARAVVYGLLERGFAVDVVNRSRQRAEVLAAQFGARVATGDMRQAEALLAQADLLVNTTSLGMVGMPELTLDIGRLKPDALVCDIVYVPRDTALLRAARQRHLRSVGGLGMLLHQAVPGFERWFGVRPSVSASLRAIIEDDIARATAG